MKLEHSIIPNRKIKTQNGLNIFVRLHTINLLQENIGRTLFDINHSSVFSDPPLRVMKTKTNVNKWDLIKFKSFCTAKETINKTKMKKQTKD